MIYFFIGLLIGVFVGLLFGYMVCDFHKMDVLMKESTATYERESLKREILYEVSKLLEERK